MGNKHKEKVSIIIPCYNDGRYLKESIDSARSQTYPNKEIVLVDDGSDDALTLEIIDCLEHSSEIRVLHANHGGPAAARNFAIRVAEGEFILPLDSDDKISPDYLAKAVPILIDSPNVGIVYSMADYFDAWEGPWDIEKFSFGHMLFENMIFNTALFRKSDWKKAGGYCETLGALEDWDFWLSILELGRTPVRMEERLFHYRIRQGKDSYSDREDPPEIVLKLYHDIMTRHVSLYQREVAAYSDWVHNKILWDADALRKYQKQLEAAQRDQVLLSTENRWVRIAKQIPWNTLEARLKNEFPLWKKRFAMPVRLALGLHIIQAEVGLSGSLFLLELEENSYWQYFCGLMGSEESRKLTLEDLSYLQERMTSSLLDQINEVLKG